MCETSGRLTLLQEDIRTNFPGFAVHSFRKLGEGRRSIAVLVNGEWVFRFPKEEEGAEELRKEIAILPGLAESVTLAIPRFEYIGEQRSGMPFVGYRRLPGEIIGETGMPSLPEHMQLTVARQLAQFMDELNAFPVATARELGVPAIDLAGEIREAMESVKTIVFPMLDQETRRYALSRYEAYFGEPGFAAYTPRLIHADLSPDHFLLDPAEGRLTGIIDFGDLQISDPDYEYLYLLEDCGPGLTREVMLSRGQEDVERTMEKASLLVTFDQLAYILEGMENGDPDWIAEGLEAIRAEMAADR